jgi:hypothetical protein
MRDSDEMLDATRRKGDGEIEREETVKTVSDH